MRRDKAVRDGIGGAVLQNRIESTNEIGSICFLPFHLI
jgi:hypothetical protein